MPFQYSAVFPKTKTLRFGGRPSHKASSFKRLRFGQKKGRQIRCRRISALTQGFLNLIQHHCRFTNNPPSTRRCAPVTTTSRKSAQAPTSPSNTPMQREKKGAHHSSTCPKGRIQRGPRGPLVFRVGRAGSACSCLRDGRRREWDGMGRGKDRGWVNKNARLRKYTVCDWGEGGKSYRLAFRAERGLPR